LNIKQLFLISLLALAFIIFASCNKGNTPQNLGNQQNNDMMSNKIRIKVGAKVFKATLLDNATAKAFKTLLPITINMIELNQNEKYFNLASNLPSNASNPGTIQNGDLMLYGANTLVLFYKTFSTSYSYTKLGQIEDTTGLVDALGASNVQVRIELEQ